MNRRHPGSPFVLRLWYLLGIIIIILIIILILLYFYWHPRKPATWVTAKDGKVSWNILFKPGTDKATRDLAVTNIKNEVRNDYDIYNAKNGTNYQPKSDTAYFCPCDTLLYNFDFLSVDGAGKSVTTAPSPPPKVPGSGDLVDAVISNNALVLELIKASGISKDSTDTASVKGNRTDPSKILAIIDSGLDSSFFGPAIKNLVWTDPSFPTLYNFLPGQPVSNIFDSTKEKHGTAVAAIIIKAMDNTLVYPKLMILRALDSSNTGSIYSVSCALSYAVQKNATLLNLSLGYYGDADSILHHYIAQCAAPGHPIRIFAAAGNTPGDHNSALCNHNSHNELGDSLKFYPACFSTEFDNITSVTQISKVDSSCFYQNFSDKYISLGIYDSIYCCETLVDFMHPRNNYYKARGYSDYSANYYEGSSFATPVASGLKMGTILNATDPADEKAKWDALIKTNTNYFKVTKGGKYIEYSSGRQQ